MILESCLRKFLSCLRKFSALHQEGLEILKNFFASQIGELRSEMEANFGAAGASNALLQTTILQELQGIRRALGVRDDPSNTSAAISFSPVKDTVSVTVQSERKVPAKESWGIQPVSQKQEGAEHNRAAISRGENTISGRGIHNSQPIRMNLTRTDEWLRKARVVSVNNSMTGKEVIGQPESNSMANNYKLYHLEQRSPRWSAERTTTHRHAGAENGLPNGNAGRQEAMLMPRFDRGAMLGKVTFNGAGMSGGVAAQALKHELNAGPYRSYDGSSRSRQSSIYGPIKTAYMERLEVLRRSEAQTDALDLRNSFAGLGERMAALRTHQTSVLQRDTSEIVFTSGGRIGGALAPALLHGDMAMKGDQRKQRGNRALMNPASNSHF